MPSIRKIRLRQKRKGSTVGKRCSTYQDGCVICDTWKFFDMHKKFPSHDELFKFMEKNHD